MQEQQWQLIQDIFNAALGQDATQRDHFIAQRCAQDKVLITQVNALLSAHLKSDQYLSSLSRELYPLIKEEIPQRTTVAHYELLEQLGEGGMGVVYRAFDTRLLRTVAIKFIALGRADSKAARERFLHEAKAAAQLNHANVCDVFEVSESNEGQLYLVTPFCEGRNFSALLAEKQLSMGAVLHILMQLTDALCAAHAKGIYHRDLKPANIIVDDNMQVKLVDFGIAKIVGVDVSRTGEMVGSVSYMSPEQFTGANVAHGCDIWSLGVLLYEAFSGERPFKADSPAQVMYQLFHSDVPQLSAQDIPLLSRLNKIIHRCMQLDQYHRYPDADSLLADLQVLYQQLQADDLLNTVPLRQQSNKPPVYTETKSHQELRKVTALALQFHDPLHLAKVQTIIVNAGGHIVDNNKSGILYAYFGYPKLGEGASDNAISCALKLQQYFDQRTDQGQQQISIVMDNIPLLFSEQETGEGFTLTGDLPGGLASLLDLETSKRLLWTESVNRRLRSPLPLATRITLAGKSVYSNSPSFGDTMGRRFSSPFIGRQHERGLLQHRWQQILEGESSALLLSGEAGIGKTRLVHELKLFQRESANSELIECASDPSQSDSPLFPIIKGLQQWLHNKSFIFSMQEQASLPDSTALLLNRWLQSLQLDTSEHLPYLSWLMGLTEAGDYPLAQRNSPELLKKQSLKSLQDCLAAQAQRRPLLLIIEDLHWADNSTLEWLDTLLSTPLPPGLMVLLTGRTELFQRWRTYSDFTHLALSRLNKTETKKLILSIMHKQQVVQQLETQILEKTAGNPLFIEEYTQMLLVEGEYKADTVTSVQVPDSLQETLLSRLDKLGNAKKTAQVAAVIGRVFNAEMLQMLLACPPVTLDNQLAQLVEANVIYHQNQQAHQYIFKHALIQDALYLSLPEQQRQSLHLQLAEQLQNLLEGTAESDKQDIKAELIAHHFSAAKQYALAIPLWLQAARQALQTHATEESVALSQRGLHELEYLPSCTQRDEWEIALQMTLGPALMATKGYSDQGVANAYQRALDLCDSSQNLQLVLPVLFGLWTYMIVRAKFKEGIRLTRRMVDIAESEDSDDYRVEAYLGHGMNHYYLGFREKAKANLDTCLRYYQPEMTASHAPVYGQDPYVIALSYLSWIVQEEGQGELAKEYSNQAMSRARICQHPFTLCYAQVYAGAVHILSGDLQQAEQLLKDNLKLCETQGVKELFKLTSVFDGILTITKGDAEKGLEQFRSAMAIFKTTGAEMFFPLWMTFEAQTLAQLGRVQEARAVLQQAKKQAEADSALVYIPRIELALKSLDTAQ